MSLVYIGLMVAGFSMCLWASDVIPALRRKMRKTDTGSRTGPRVITHIKVRKENGK